MSINEEMLKKAMGDMDTCKEEVLKAMECLVSEKKIAVRAMLFSTLTVVLHAIHHMSDGDQEEVDDFVKYSLRMISLIEEVHEEVEEEQRTGTTH